MSEGPFKHTRQLDGWLRQYGAKTVTGQEVLGNLRGNIVVDDVSVLTPPVEAPIAATEVPGTAQAGEYSYVRLTAGGRGVWILECHTGGQAGRIETFTTGSAPAFGAVGPTNVPFNTVFNLRKLTMQAHVTSKLEYGSRAGSASGFAPALDVSDFPAFFPVYILPGTVFTFTATTIATSAPIKRLVFQEIPALGPDLGS